MRIVIANGNNSADYIIKNFKGRSHQLTIINDDKYSEYFQEDMIFIIGSMEFINKFVGY